MRPTRTALWPLLACLLASAGCSTMQIGAGNCQARISDKILNDHPQSRGSTFDADSVQRRRQGDDTILVTGRGRVRTKKGDYRHFTYKCVYNQRAERVTSASYTIN